MGLDGVELVISFEEAFGIELKDEEVTKTVTPRMVTDLIFSKLRTAEERVCRSQRAFYMIRKVLCQTFGLERKSITPDMRFRDCVARSQEKQMWEQIRAAVSPHDWPALARPLWMSRSLVAVGFVIFVATVLGAIRSSSGTGLYIENWIEVVFLSALGGLILAGLFGVVVGLLTRPFRFYIPTHFVSIRDRTHSRDAAKKSF